ncbi:MAG: hypothetical protein KAQ68_07770, partial [Clostridiales bacterium]|nr:hypothetical protein [Clostridiales bacterium]
MSNTQQLINKMVREYEKLISRFIKFLEKEPYNKNMKTYQKGIDKMLAIQNVELNRVADTIVKELIPKVYEEGLERATKAVKQKANKAKEFSVKEFLKNKKEIDDTMSRSTKRHVQEVNTLIDQTSMALKTANYKFRKQVKQSIRKIAKEIESLEIDVGIQMKFLKERLAEDIKTNKNITKIEDNVKHIIKTAKNESQNMSMARYAMETGIDLVQMSSHSPTCKICQMYQGRVYSVSGKDKRFPSLFDTAFKSGYANIHPNCNHKIRIYTSSLKRREDIHGAIKKSNSPFNDQQTVKQKDRYDALQKKKRQLRVDRLLWERYKSRLGIEIVPSSFSKFKKVKDSEGKKWRNIENIYKLAGDSEKLLYYLHGKYYNTNNGIKKVEFDEEIANDQKIQEFAADMEKNVDSLVQAILSQLEKSSNKLDKDEKDSIENLVKNFPKMISSTKRSSTDKKKLIMKTIKEFVSLEKISGDKSDILRRISYAVDTGKAPKLERAIDYVLDIAYLEDMEQRLNIDKGVGGGGSKSWNTEEKKEQFELRVPSGYKTIDIEDYLKSV